MGISAHANEHHDAHIVYKSLYGEFKAHVDVWSTIPGRRPRNAKPNTRNGGRCNPPSLSHFLSLSLLCCKLDVFVCGLYVTNKFICFAKKKPQNNPQPQTGWLAAQRARARFRQSYPICLVPNRTVQVIIIIIAGQRGREREEHARFACACQQCILHARPFFVCVYVVYAVRICVCLTLGFLWVGYGRICLRYRIALRKGFCC